MRTDLLWDLTLLFVGVGVLYFLGIFYFRRRESLESKSIAKRKSALSPMVSEFLFFDENAPKDEKANYLGLKIEIRELLNDPRNRKVLVDILMDLRKDLSGSALPRLYELFKSLGLHYDSYEKLKSWNWHTVSKGIVELTQMQVGESYSLMAKFINDKRPTVRKQAEIGIISLSDRGIDYFLDTTVHKISEWQQLKILEVLKSKEDFLPPPFKSWLVSTNNDIVLFALKLMKHYNQNDGNEALIELLKHRNDKVKTAAIGCIKEFYVTDAIETLKLVFWDSTVNIKIDILDAIAVLGSLKDIKFLRSIGSKQSNFNVRSKALATINALAPMTVMPTKDIKDISKFKVPEDIFSKDAVDHLEEQTDLSVVSSESGDSNGHGDLDHEKRQKAKFEAIETPVHSPDRETDPIDEGDTMPVEPFIGIDARPMEGEVNSISLDFLPIVRETGHEILDRYRPSKTLNGPEDVLEYDVRYEILGDEKTVRDQREGSDTGIDQLKGELGSISLDFLPIVVGLEDEGDMSRNGPGYRPNDISNLAVVYTEVGAGAIRPKESKILPILRKLVPLSHAKTVPNDMVTPRDTDSTKPKTLNQTDMKKIGKIHCEDIEIKVIKPMPMTEGKKGMQSTVDEKYEIQDEQNTLEWVMAENEARMELKQKIRSIVEKGADPKFEIPKPAFTNEFEYDTISLLDHVEILGDKREVPLLKEMLRNERIESLWGRIESLIEKISDASVLRRDTVQYTPDLQVISVFQQFFETMDTRSKLIMLDEIVAVGDEREVEFLGQLVDDADAKVRKKAMISLETLKAKLREEAKEEEGEPRASNGEPVTGNQGQGPAKPFNVFDIDFGLELDDVEGSQGQESI